MTSISLTLSAFALAATLAAPALAEQSNPATSQPADPIADEGGAGTQPATPGTSGGRQRHAVIPIDDGPAQLDHRGGGIGIGSANDARIEQLADGLFMAFGGMTWEGLAAQARWSEAYVAGGFGRYDRQRYDDCLAFLDFYYELLARTALIDVELEVFLTDVGVLSATTDDPVNGELQRPAPGIDTDDDEIPNGEA
ncbi:MAG: hypothetical protein JNM94_13475 [Phycisphaerae bacterium]|nr:hypothetical protein [Phycisphaerae bacterium]